MNAEVCSNAHTRQCSTVSPFYSNMKPEQQLLGRVILSYSFFLSLSQLQLLHESGVFISKSDLLLSTQSICNSSHCGLHGCTIIILFSSSINAQGFPTTGMNVKVIFWWMWKNVFLYNTEQSPCGARATAHMSFMDLQYSSNFTFLVCVTLSIFLYFVQSAMRILDLYDNQNIWIIAAKELSLSAPKRHVH